MNYLMNSKKNAKQNQKQLFTLKVWKLATMTHVQPTKANKMSNSYLLNSITNTYKNLSLEWMMSPIQKVEQQQSLLVSSKLE